MRDNFSIHNRRTIMGYWLLSVAFILLLAACSSDKPPAKKNSESKPDITSAEAGTAAAVKLQIASDGLYRIPLADLQQAGLNADSLDIGTIAVKDGATNVPILLQDDSLIFYGQAPDSPYTANRAYVVQTGEAGMPMETTTAAASSSTAINAIPQTIHLEQNMLYTSEARETGSEDLWFWEELRQQSSLPFDINLDAVSALPGTVRLNLWGFTHNREIENDHDFDLVINDQTLGTVQWDGQTFHTAELDIPEGILTSGSNNILLDNTPEGANFLDIVRLNWIDLTYSAPPSATNDVLSFTSTAAGVVKLTDFSSEPIVIDVSNPIAPILLTDLETTSSGASVPVSAEQSIAAVGAAGGLQPVAIAPMRTGEWASADHQADLLIITTDELAPALEPLVAHRAEQGIVSAVIPVEELYDEFGGGNNTPEAIQKFVAHALENWQDPKPQYLFIVGDATTDYKNYLGTNPSNIVPPLLVPTQASGETVSDSRLVDINDDMQPDIAVGRWPVSKSAQVEDLVARTIAYESGSAVNRAIFAADGTEAYFEDIAQRLATDHLAADTESSILPGATSAEVADAINAGAWLATYVGHGSITQWGKEDIFTIDAVDALNSSAPPPIVLQLTCLTGLFAHPEQTSLTETMLTNESGPVLLVAATSLTYSTHQEPFATTFIDSLRDPEISRIGDAFQAAKLSLNVSDNGFREVSDTFALFGDPSATIVRPE